MIFPIRLRGYTYALGLHDAVDERTGEASEDLLRLGVAVGLAVLRNVVLVGLGSLAKDRSGYGCHYRRSATHLVGRRGGNELVGELSLVRGVADLVWMGLDLR